MLVVVLVVVSVELVVDDEFAEVVAVVGVVAVLADVLVGGVGVVVVVVLVVGAGVVVAEVGVDEADEVVVEAAPELDTVSWSHLTWVAGPAPLLFLATSLNIMDGF